MVNRWWLYQRERFPLGSFALLAFVLAFSALAYSALTRGVHALPGAGTLVAAAASAFLLFMQMVRDDGIICAAFFQSLQ